MKVFADSGESELGDWPAARCREYSDPIHCAFRSACPRSHAFRAPSHVQTAARSHLRRHPSKAAARLRQRQRPRPCPHLTLRARHHDGCHPDSEAAAAAFRVSPAPSTGHVQTAARSHLRRHPSKAAARLRQRQRPRPCPHLTLRARHHDGCHPDSEAAAAAFRPSLLAAVPPPRRAPSLTLRRNRARR